MNAVEAVATKYARGLEKSFPDRHFYLRTVPRIEKLEDDHE